MNKIQEKFEKWKIEREVDDHNESYAFREGYVKAMCDAINLVKNNVDLADVNPCKGCGENCKDKSSYPMCENCIMG